MRKSAPKSRRKQHLIKPRCRPGIGRFLGLVVQGKLNLALDVARNMSKDQLDVAFRSPLPRSAALASCLSCWVSYDMFGNHSSLLPGRDYWAFYDIMRRHGGISFESATTADQWITPLHAASNLSDSVVLDRLANEPLIPAEAWSCLDPMRRTPLMDAIRRAKEDSKAQQLVPRTNDEALNGYDAHGYRALTYAIRHEKVQTLQAILSRIPAIEIEINSSNPSLAYLKRKNCAVSIEEAFRRLQSTFPPFNVDRCNTMLELVQGARSEMQSYLVALCPVVVQSSMLLPDLCEVICGYTHFSYTSAQMSQVTQVTSVSPTETTPTVTAATATTASI